MQITVVGISAPRAVTSLPGAFLIINFTAGLLNVVMFGVLFTVVLLKELAISLLLDARLLPRIVLLLEMCERAIAIG
jgi:hypothetical protein